MKNSNNPSFRPGQREVDEITKRARKGARDGAIVGGTLGYVGGAIAPRGLRKARLVGAGLGTAGGYVVGKKVGRKIAAKDDVDSRKALRQGNQLAEVIQRTNELVARLAERDGIDLETIDEATAATPVRPGQLKIVRRPSVRGMRSEPGDGVSSEAEFFSPARQAIADKWGYLVAESLEDDQLDDAHAKIVYDVIQDQMAKANGPHASTQNDPEFERHVLAQHLGHQAVSEMSDKLVHANFLGDVRRGLISLDDQDETTDFGLVDRIRNDQGEFVDNEVVSPQAIQRAYHPRDRKTGIEAAGAGLAAGAAGLGVRAFFKGRKGSRLKLPPGVAKSPGSGATTKFSAGHPGSYRISRATLKVKKQPGLPRLRGGKRVPKPARHNMAFLIHDPDFPIVPMKQPKLPPSMKQRVPVAKTRAEVIARMKKLTELSSGGGLGKAAAETIIDATTIGADIGPKKKKLMVDANGNVINPQFLKDPGTTSTSSFASAIARLHEFGFGSAITSGVARDAGVITAADLTAEELHDAIQQARQKKKKKMAVNGGIEAQSPAGPTALCSVNDTLVEFDRGRERMKRDATTAGAAGAGGAAGAIAGLKHDSGVPIRESDLQPGMRVTKRFGPAGLFQHVGVVDESGRVVHRTSGSSKLRSVKPSTFQKTGKGPMRHEVHSDDLPPRQAAANASRATGTRAGRYSACQGNNCQDAAERLISKGKPVSRQLRKALSGAAIGAAGLGSVAHILQGGRKGKDQHGNR